jgi:methyltransferase family protein
MQLTLSSVVKGAATWLPYLSRLANTGTGGTVSARYCYSVWMRHLCTVTQTLGVARPHCVAELGPGDSLGIGLAAMLCGADRYYALDRKAFANSENNVTILDELAALLRSRAAIPDDVEFPGVFPKLDNYGFPTTLLDDTWLDHCLAPTRVESIRRAAAGAKGSDGTLELRYFAPWDDSAAILPESVDWVFSQAVLEHVDNITAAYANLMKWLRHGGLMSHAIDYTCHGLTRDWNGHWTVGEGMWEIARGKRSYLINRLPHSAHMQMIRECGFNIVKEIRVSGETLARATVAPRFRQLTDEDLSTMSAFIVALKP